MEEIICPLCATQKRYVELQLVIVPKARDPVDERSKGDRLEGPFYELRCPYSKCDYVENWSVPPA